MNARMLRWGIYLIVTLGILLACKLINQGTTLPLIGATPTLPPTSTPLPATLPPPPSPTPPPTLAPTSTHAPVPPLLPTSPAPPSPTQRPENKNATLAHVRITNGLGAAIKIVLNGPSQRSFTVYSLSNLEVDLVPGAYNFTITATGYLPLSGTRTFNPGNNTWSIGKE